MTQQESLSAVARKTGRDIPAHKSDHYLNFYEEFFAQWADGRLSKLNIVELGILNGGSTLLFAEYFPNARILSVDINRPPNTLYECLDRDGLTSRVSISIGSQDDQDFLKRSIDAHFGQEMVDLVIDDASHMYGLTTSSYEILFPTHLRPGGWYVVEDWGCGYWPKWPDGNPDGQHGLPLFVKERIDELALFERTRDFHGARALPVDEAIHPPIERMVIIPGILAMKKARAL